MTAGLRYDELAGLSCPKCEARDSWKLVGRVTNRLNSKTAFASCERCGERIFVKKLLPSMGESAEACAAQEFATATWLDRAFRDKTAIGVVHPLARLSAVIAFEFIDGRTVSEILRSGTFAEQQLAMMAAGSWFAHFHESSAEVSGSGDFIDKFGVIANRCAADSHLPAIADVALAYLRDGATRKLADRALSMARVHGDAKPDNFILAGDRLLAIDVDGRFSNIGEMDLAQFLVQSSIAQSNLIGFLDDGIAQILEFSFLQGYERFRAADREALAWMTIYFWLSFWMSARERGRLQSLRLNALFNQRLDVCLRSIDVSLSLRPPDLALPEESPVGSRPTNARLRH